MKKCILIMLILILLLCGCTEKPPVAQPKEYEYDTHELTYSEPAVQYGFRVNMDCTESTHARYYFEQTIDKAERALCIDATDKILAKQTALNSLPEIYIFTEKRFPDTSIVENKLYTSTQDWKTVEFATKILLTAYGAYSHYGLAYGYASFICDEQITDSAFKTPDASDVCDLNLLCFDTAFASNSDISTAKSIACDFVQAFIADKGESALQELLAASKTSDGARSVSDALANYYKDNGFDYVPSALRYGYGGHSFDYIVSTNLGVFYIKKDWIDMNAEYNPLITDGFLHSNYADTKRFFHTNLEQMKQYQTLFALDSYNNDLNIIFADTNLSQTSFYQSNTHTIYLKNIDSFMHEYIHALTQPTYSMELWEAEGFARYFSYYYDFYGIAFLNQDYNNCPDTPELKYIHEYLSTINRPIDMAKDYTELENIVVHSRSFTDPNKSYVTGSSFVQYLVKQYGEEAVISSIYGNGDPLPKTYAELVKEWNEYIEVNYKDYSKYK